MDNAELLTRITAAIGSIGPLEKDKRNQHGGYDYLSEEAVKRVLAKACVEHGITPPRIEMDMLASEDVPAKQGTQHRCIIRCTLRWSETVFAQGIGCGVDYGDKAVMKAQTAAFREAAKNRLCLATGHDPEGDPSTDRESGRAPDRPAAPPQRPQTPQQPRREAAPPRPAARRSEPPARGLSGLTVPFGKHKGEPIEAQSVGTLEMLIEAFERTLGDPSKKRFWDSEREKLRVASTVLEGLRADMDESRDDGPPPHSDDDGGWVAGDNRE